MGQTASSSHSRANTPVQIHPGHCRHLTTQVRGCQGSQAKDSTRLVCPLDSTTRSVIPHRLPHSLLHKTHSHTHTWEYKEIYHIFISFYFSYSKNHSMVKTPTSLEVDTPTVKAMGYVWWSYPQRTSSVSMTACQDFCAQFDPVMYVKLSQQMF